MVWIAMAVEAAAPDTAVPRHHSVVAYLVSPTGHAEIEDEAFADRRRPKHPWQWRVFDPATGRDSLFMTLQCFPTRVRWDPDYRFVEYAVGDRIERAPWRIGARPLEQIRLPLDSALCDFWSDRAGGWHAVTQSSDEPAERGPIRILTSWDRRQDGRWRVAAVDTAAEGYGSCLDAGGLGGSERASAVKLQDMLDAMRGCQVRSDRQYFERPGNGRITDRMNDGSEAMACRARARASRSSGTLK